MSRHNRLTRITALVLAIVLIAAEAAFAASIVSPADGSIAYSDSLLVSVKLSDQKTVRITVYKEQIGTEKEVVKENGVKTTEVVYSDADASALTEEDISLISSGNLTDENGEALLLSSGDEIPDYHDSVFAEAVEYTNSTAGIGFYTKKLTGVGVGLYKVKVETLGSRKEVTDTVVSYAAVKEKKEEKRMNVFASLFCNDYMTEVLERRELNAEKNWTCQITYFIVKTFSNSNSLISGITKELKDAVQDSAGVLYSIDGERLIKNNNWCIGTFCESS